MTGAAAYESFRCPHCGGSNERDAEWCGQCYERFRMPSPQSERYWEEASPAPPYLEGLAGILGVEEPPEAIERVVDLDRRVWMCSGCGTENALSGDECSACRRPFKDSARVAVAEVAAERRAESDALANDAATGVLAALRGGPLALPLAAIALLTAALKALLRRMVRGRPRF